MMVFKRKQIVILALILMIVVAGYLQYSYSQRSTSADSNSKLGEAVYVDSELTNEALDSAEQGTPTADAGKVQKNVTATKMANDYFAQTKMDKEQSRSKNEESLKAIAEDTSAAKETRAEAYDKRMALVETSDKEMRIESLINKMGFNDCVVVFADDGSVDVVVKTPSLSTAQTAQITDIITRQAEVKVDDIHIKPLF
jgi:stage III sporulation protein AH